MQESDVEGFHTAPSIALTPEQVDQIIGELERTTAEKPGVTYLEFESSTDGGSTAPPSGLTTPRRHPAYSVHSTLSRAVLASVRPRFRDYDDLQQLCDYRLVVSEHTAPLVSGVRFLSTSDDATAEMSPRSQAAIVWHEIAALYSIMPAVQLQCMPARACMFCPTRVTVGWPVVMLTHVCNTDATEQRLRLAVHVSCQNCTRERIDGDAACMDKSPLRRVSYVFVLERLTLHARYVLERINASIPAYDVEVAKPAAHCDYCEAAFAETSDLRVVAMVRLDEISLLVACSEECETRLRAVLAGMFSPPRPLSARDGLTSPRKPADGDDGARKKRAAVAERFDEKFARGWSLLSAEAFDQLVAPGPDKPSVALPPNKVIHRCDDPDSCFCRFTHRAKARGSRGARALQYANYNWINHVFDGLVACNLYTDILGSDSDARCLHCQNPCTRVCTECTAVRVCHGACETLSMKEHQRLCRPRGTAWTRRRLC